MFARTAQSRSRGLLWVGIIVMWFSLALWLTSGSRPAASDNTKNQPPIANRISVVVPPPIPEMKPIGGLECPKQEPPPQNVVAAPGRNDSNLDDCFQAFLKALSDKSDNAPAKALSQSTKDLLTALVSVFRIQVFGSTGGSLLDHFNRFLFQEAHLMRVKTAEHVKSIVAESKQRCDAHTKTRIAVCTFQYSGTAPFVQEWLVHHLILGIEKFYFMVNEPENEAAPLLRALQPFIEAGVVEWQSAYKQGDYPQDAALSNCALSHKDEWDWIGALDGDEYVMLHKPNLQPQMCLGQLLDGFKDFGGVLFPWRQMSSLGAPLHDFSKTFFEQYHYTRPEYHVKSFHQAKYLVKVAAHYADYSHGKFFVDWDKKPAQQWDFRENPTRFVDYELRHFWDSGWMHLILEKICGPRDGRQRFRQQRINLALEFMTESKVQRVPESAGERIHTDMLRKALKL